MITVGLIRAIMPSCRNPELWAPELSSALDLYKITDPDAVAAFLAQVAVESAEMNRVEENLSYSAPRLCAVWPKRFPTLADAEPYARNPQALAGKVYDGRMGNGPGDGWKFRGRGLKMVTGRNNYKALDAATGWPVLSDPDMLLLPKYAAASAAHFWASQPQDLSKIADDLPDDDDEADFISISKVVNGGTIGLPERQRYWQRARKALGLLRAGEE